MYFIAYNVIVIVNTDTNEAARLRASTV